MVKTVYKGEVCMSTRVCKRCGSAQTVKCGTARGKQRYLCKKCGYHFVAGDERANRSTAVLKALCIIFRALGIKQHRKIGECLHRDAAQIYDWMENNHIDTWCSRRASPCAEKKRFIKSLENVLGDDAALAAEGVYNDLYIALVVKRLK